MAWNWFCIRLIYLTLLYQIFLKYTNFRSVSVNTRAVEDLLAGQEAGIETLNIAGKNV